MHLEMGVLAVQVGATHHRLPDGGDAWQIGLLALGLVLLGRGSVPWWRTRRWRAAAARAHGCVIDRTARRGRRQRLHWMPIIEFQADGGNVMFVGPAAASEGSWPLGLEVDVLYDRADPYRAGLADATGLVPWSLVAGIALLAAFALAVAV